ncbi:hypothetical protein MFIFM68171_08052 [Madurella fahalii]|uniref:Heterokaryon incompatibility domain-containing protein n=1 Tax=Madurella fahalii TaxID=1157608 RepID=A0ABQ0GJA2_9PEZI
MPSTDSLATSASAIDRRALYISIPLDHRVKQTRFLKLLPGEDDSNLRGELFALSLHSEPDFTALSYAWASPGAGQTISVNGCNFPISDSLHLALHTIRRRFCATSSVTLWIDLICINQEDTTEKNTQVPLMSDIYTGASSVIVWLGAASAVDGLAMTVMGDLAARGGEEEAMAIGDPSVATMQALADRIPTGNSIRDLLGAAFPDLRGQVNELLTATRRVDIQPVLHLRERVQAGTEEGDMSLETIMWETTQALATNPRDKVYGVLALAPKAAWDRISVDYSREVEDVYADVVRYSFINMGGLGIPADTLDTIWPSDRRLVLFGIPIDEVAHVDTSFRERVSERVDVCTCVTVFSRVESHRPERIPWEYNIRKPFRDVLWRAFISDYLVDYDRNTTEDQVPAHPQANERVLELLLNAAGKNAAEVVQQLLRPEPPTEYETDEHGGEKDEPSAILKDKIITGLTMVRVANGRCAFVMAGGWLGFDPPSMKPGDVVVVFAGAGVPFVIRPDGCTGAFLLVGEAYVAGLMHGELFDQCPAFNAQDNEYTIELQRFCLR